MTYVVGRLNIRYGADSFHACNPFWHEQATFFFPEKALRSMIALAAAEDVRSPNYCQCACTLSKVPSDLHHRTLCKDVVHQAELFRA